jgi:alpha-glucosidase
MKALQITSAQVREQAAVCQTSEGAELTVRFLAPSLARITLRPAIGYKEPRTWAICPIKKNANVQDEQDVPWQGRERDSVDGFDLPVVEASSAQSTDGSTNSIALRTSHLTVAVQTHPLRLSWADARTGLPIFADRDIAAYMTQPRTGAVRHYLQRDLQDRVYGLGDKTGPLDLTERRLRTAAMDSLGYNPEHGDPLYKHWPFTLSRTASGHWVGMYYDTLANCTFDLGCEHDNYYGFYRYVDIDDGDLDYYVMVGDSPAQVIAQWMHLIGGTRLPPRWSLGYAQTAMGLADAPNAQHQLDQFIDLAVSHGVPISAFHYGSGYSSNGKRRYVFTWNHDKFPDPKSLNAKFKKNGMHLVANIKPCLLDDHPAYEAVAAAGGFIQSTSSQQPVLEPFWDGAGSHLDFTNPAAIAWWQDNLTGQVLNYGIDVGWNDNNEYAILDEDATSNGFGVPIPIHRSRALHALLMTRATLQAQQNFATKNQLTGNVFTVTRAGSPGIQRYAQTWSGDNTTCWRTLRWNIRTGLQMSLSGMFNIGHDVGGFHGPVPEPELFLRWVQASCLNPRMVMNSWKEGGVSNVPWMHPSVTQDVIQAITLRYRLMPYLWSLFERASAQHQPILRPTFYDFPDDNECYKDSDDFMVGESLLMAPVVEQGQTQRTVYLPALTTADNSWYDFATGQRYAAGQYHVVDVAWSTMPLFVKSGSRIPVAHAVSGQRAAHDDPTLQVLQFGL